MFVVPKYTSEECHSCLASNAMLDSTEEWSKALHQWNTNGSYSKETSKNLTVYAINTLQSNVTNDAVGALICEL